MTIKLPSETLTFYFQFTYGGAGKTGLTVTVDVYDTDHATLLVNNGAATEIADGFYYYTLSATLNDAAGDYLAIATTAGTSDLNDVGALWTVRGSLDLTESGAGDGLPLTLVGLRYFLRVKLDDLTSEDSAGGNWKTKHLDRFINLAYRETCMKAKCHKLTKSLTLVAGTHTYDCAEIFHPLEIRLSEVEIKRRTLGDMGISLEAWNNDPQGLPTEWLQLTGSNIRLHHTPNASAAGVITGITAAPIAGGASYVVGDVLTLAGGTGGTVTVVSVTGGVVTEVKLTTGGYDYEVETKATTGGAGTGCTVAISQVGVLKVHGLARPTTLDNDGDIATAIPEAFCASAILDRAECHARRSRPDHPNNVGLAKQLEDNWNNTVELIKAAVRAEN